VAPGANPVPVTVATDPPGPVLGSMLSRGVPGVGGGVVGVVGGVVVVLFGGAHTVIGNVS